jgi:hypothetical protein
MQTIREIINQEISFKLNEGAIMGIFDLIEMVSRIGFDKNIARKMFQDAFRSGGDESVKKMFKEITHLDLDNTSTGKYTIKY